MKKTKTTLRSKSTKSTKSKTPKVNKAPKVRKLKTTKDPEIAPYLLTKPMEEMTLYQLCRWGALLDAIEVIGDKCDERGVDFFTLDLKQLDVFNYIDKAADTLYAHATQA